MIHELFAYLCVKDANAAIAFYARAFGATEKFRLTEPGGRIGHAEVDLDGITLMLSEEFPECGIHAPRAGEGTPVTIHLHVDDADAVIGRALEAGATVERPVQDEFYGERGGVVRDPSGHRWNIGHSIEALSTEEMQRRYTALMQPVANARG
jgi:PhnB protein